MQRKIWPFFFVVCLMKIDFVIPVDKNTDYVSLFHSKHTHKCWGRPRDSSFFACACVCRFHISTSQARVWRLIIGRSLLTSHCVFSLLYSNFPLNFAHRIMCVFRLLLIAYAFLLRLVIFALNKMACKFMSLHGMEGRHTNTCKHAHLKKETHR